MLKLGKYQHFKGNYYQVLHLARHSETQEWLVIYKPLYTDEQGNDLGIWARPLAMFDETIEREGKEIKRFTYIDALPH